MLQILYKIIFSFEYLSWDLFHILSFHTCFTLKQLELLIIEKNSPVCSPQIHFQKNHLEVFFINENGCSKKWICSKYVYSREITGQGDKTCHSISQIHEALAVQPGASHLISWASISTSVKQKLPVLPRDAGTGRQTTKKAWSLKPPQTSSSVFLRWPQGMWGCTVREKESVVVPLNPGE